MAQHSGIVACPQGRYEWRPLLRVCCESDKSAQLCNGHVQVRRSPVRLSTWRVNNVSGSGIEAPAYSAAHGMNGAKGAGGDAPPTTAGFRKPTRQRDARDVARSWTPRVNVTVRAW